PSPPSAPKRLPQRPRRQESQEDSWRPWRLGLVPAEAWQPLRVIQLHRGRQHLADALLALFQVRSRGIVHQHGLLILERALDAPLDLAQVHPGQTAGIRRNGPEAKEEVVEISPRPAPEHQVRQLLEVLALQVAANDRRRAVALG